MRRWARRSVMFVYNVGISPKDMKGSISLGCSLLAELFCFCIYWHLRLGLEVCMNNVPHRPRFLLLALFGGDLAGAPWLEEVHPLRVGFESKSLPALVPSTSCLSSKRCACCHALTPSWTEPSGIVSPNKLFFSL